MKIKSSFSKCADSYSKNGNSKLIKMIQRKINDAAQKIQYLIQSIIINQKNTYNFHQNSYMTSLKLQVLLLLVVISYQKCQNNGTLLQENDTCLCQPGFIGKNCNISAYQLKETEIKIPIGVNFTYAYFQPEQKVIYRFVLTFCSANKSQELDFIVYAQQEQKNGQIQLFPTNARDILELMVGGNKECKQIVSTILVSMDKKINGQLPKIIFGFRLVGISVTLQGQYLTAKCQTSSFFTINFLVTIVISFFVIVTFFMLASIAIMIRRKFLQRRLTLREQKKKIQCVNKLMPTKKYETLVEEGVQVDPYEITCSICLCQFQKGQNVRKTPCGHIYHENCLDSWCNSHLNCPICRKNFEEQQQAKTIEESLRETNNVREAMLQ